jgi:general secretion pathway protein N
MRLKRPHQIGTQRKVESRVPIPSPGPNFLKEVKWITLYLGAAKSHNSSAQIDGSGMVGEQMIRRCACVIVAMASFSVHGALGRAPAGGSLQGSGADRASPNMEQPKAAAKTPELRAPPLGGNPLWGIPMSALSATRERPIFSVSRRPPAPPPPPMPVAEAPPPPPAEPEQPPLTLVGTAIGKSHNVALVFNQTSKIPVRLHVGETASGWYLRSIDLRKVTLEKNSHVVTLSLPVPGSAKQPTGPPLLAPEPGLRKAGTRNRTGNRTICRRGQARPQGTELGFGPASSSSQCWTKTANSPALPRSPMT